MKNIFKKDDRVFAYVFGWGTVIYVDNKDEFPIGVKFDTENNESFTYDGRYYFGEAPILSFTEYTLEGFTQERPEPLPKIGDIVWVREYGSVDWRVSHFFGKSGDRYLASIFGIKELAATWAEMTTKNPHVNDI